MLHTLWVWRRILSYILYTKNTYIYIIDITIYISLLYLWLGFWLVCSCNSNCQFCVPWKMSFSGNKSERTKSLLFLKFVGSFSRCSPLPRAFYTFVFSPCFFFGMFLCFQWMIWSILIVNRWFVKRCLELERKRCHAVTAKLIDYEFTMVPATQFVSGSGI